MVSVLDVAAYILEKQGVMTTMKLQKLCYYSQAWSLVWDDRRLFEERIEAWANGPVIPELYERHRGLFQIGPGSLKDGEPRKLDAEGKETVDAVLDYYGDKSSHWLSELTHAEPPWKEARGNLGPGDHGSAEITPAAMAEYYGALV